MKGNIYIFPIFLFLSILSIFGLSCFSSDNAEKSNVNMNYFYVYPSESYPYNIYPKTPFQISLIIKESDNLPWKVCLLSFQDPAFKYSGDFCINSEEVAYSKYEYNIVLPKDGYISLEEPELLTSQSYSVNALLCYQYKSIFMLNGCISSRKICNLNINSTTVNSPIAINKAYFSPSPNGVDLVVEFSINNIQNTSNFYVTKENVLNSCNLNSFNVKNISFNYKIFIYTSDIKINNTYSYTSSINKDNKYILRVNFGKVSDMDNIVVMLTFDYYVTSVYVLPSVNVIKS